MHAKVNKKTIILDYGFSTSQAVTIISLLAAFNCWMILGSWVFTTYYRYDLAGNWAAGSAAKYILVQFHLTRETVLASWYSSMLLLLAAVAAFFCFFLDQRTNQRSIKIYFLKHGWLLLAFIFALLSADEMGSLHERIGMIPAFNLFGDQPAGWIRTLAIPIGLVAVYILWFSWARLRRNAWAFSFMLLGLIAYLINPFLEEAEMLLLDRSMGASALKQHDFYILIEEGAELFGALFFFSAAIIYIHRTIRKCSGADINGLVQNKLSIPFRTVFSGAVGMFSLFSLAMLMLYLTGFREIEGDTGIPENWFPCVMAAFDALIGIYIWKFIPNKKILLRSSYFLLALFCLFMSAYYGANLRGWLLMLPDRIPHLVHISLILSAVALIFFPMMALKRKWNFLGLPLWVIAIGSAFYLGNKYFAGYFDLAAFSILFLILIFHLEHWQSST
jgi:hypothetical protein